MHTRGSYFRGTQICFSKGKIYNKENHSEEIYQIYFYSHELYWLIYQQHDYSLI